MSMHLWYGIGYHNHRSRMICV